MARTLDVTVLASDPATDAEVGAFLDACPTSVAQQTTGWRDVITSVDRDEPLFLGCRDAGRLVGVLPAYRFRGPLGAILTSVPQAGPLGGVACHPDVDAAGVYEALLTAYIELGHSADCALVTAITNPFWPDRELYDRFFAPDFVLENSCQVLDLTAALAADGAFVGGSQNLRRNLRKAEAGTLAIDEDQSLRNVEEWFRLHALRHREIGATPLPGSLFTAALEHMVPREEARFFFVRLAESGDMVGGGLYLAHGRVVDALMPSVSSEHAALGPAYLLGLRSMRWARDRGIRYYNWQGSPPGGGVHRFKQQWGSREIGYAFVTRITGDVRPFAAASVAEIVAAYPWHYVMPFDRVGGRGRSGPSSRRDAWDALESSKR
jgi:hypothetical protein